MKRGQRWRDRRAREADDARADEVADATKRDAEHDAEERVRARFLQGLSHQWEQARVAQRQQEPVIETGPSNFSRAQVPWASTWPRRGPGGSS